MGVNLCNDVKLQLYAMHSLSCITNNPLCSTCSIIQNTVYYMQRVGYSFLTYEVEDHSPLYYTCTSLQHVPISNSGTVLSMPLLPVKLFCVAVLQLSRTLRDLQLLHVAFLIILVSTV